MKNIIWQMPGGALAVHGVPDEADSQAVAGELLSSGRVDESWTAVLFDVQEFPGPPQAAWRCVNGELVYDAEAIPPLTKEQQIAQVLATQGKGKDRLLLQQVVAFVESQAPALAAQYGVPLETALLTLYNRNKSYRECKDCETALEAIEDAP